MPKISALGKLDLYIYDKIDPKTDMKKLLKVGIPADYADNIIKWDQRHLAAVSQYRAREAIELSCLPAES